MKLLDRMAARSDGFDVRGWVVLYRKEQEIHGDPRLQREYPVELVVIAMGEQLWRLLECLKTETKNNDPVEPMVIIKRDMRVTEYADALDHVE